MKIKNILALLCFLCIGVSCSMEDDILSGVDTKGPAGIDATELYASLDLSLLVRNSNVTTKSSELTGPTDGTEENMTKDERSVSDSDGSSPRLPYTDQRLPKQYRMYKG